MTHASVPPEQRAAIGISDSLVRNVLWLTRTFWFWIKNASMYRSMSFLKSLKIEFNTNLSIWQIHSLGPSISWNWGAWGSYCWSSSSLRRCGRFNLARLKLVSTFKVNVATIITNYQSLELEIVHSAKIRYRIGYLSETLIVTMSHVSFLYLLFSVLEEVRTSPLNPGTRRT